MKFYNKRILIKILILFFLTFKVYGYDKNDIIRHAGGAIDGNTYTNSLEAVLNSIEKGYNFIELDLSLSDDGKIIFIHDWDTFKKQTNSINSNPISYEKYLNKKILKKYTTIELNKINILMNENKKLHIITDKIDNFHLLKKSFTNFDRIIIEIFGIKNYLKSFFVKKLTDKNKLFSTHMSLKHKIFIRFLNVKKITTPCSIIELNENFLKNYIKNKNEVYCYTLNNKEKFLQLKEKKLISKIYSDFL